MLKNLETSRISVKPNFYLKDIIEVLHTRNILSTK